MRVSKHLASHVDNLRFDLTSTSGLAAVATLLATGVPLASLSLTAPFALPLLTLLIANGRRETSPQLQVVTRNVEPENSAKTVLHEQKKLVLALLENGQELGLSEVEMILDNSSGIDAAVRLPKFANVDLRLKAERDNKLVVRAKFKNDA